MMEQATAGAKGSLGLSGWVSTCVLSSPHRFCVLRNGSVHLQPSRTGVHTSGGRVSPGRPALLGLAFPELRPVRRRLAQRRQRPLPHHHPQGALWRRPRGRSALLWIP